MNRCGIIIPYILKKYKLDYSNLIVLCDNMDIEPGRSKFKLKGSPAAHNGLKSITNILGTNDYMRIFIGIGHPGAREAVVAHVLGVPEDSELVSYEKSYVDTADAVLKISENLHEQVMNELNRKKSH
jgi:PTH1 family peptidyl-tRNA hydrolase